MTDLDVQYIVVGFVCDLTFSWICNAAFSFYHTFAKV